jgi:hypothetical protein
VSRSFVPIAVLSVSLLVPSCGDDSPTAEGSSSTGAATAGSTGMQTSTSSTDGSFTSSETGSETSSTESTSADTTGGPPSSGTCDDLPQAFAGSIDVGTNSLCMRPDDGSGCTIEASNGCMADGGGLHFDWDSQRGRMATFHAPGGPENWEILDATAGFLDLNFDGDQDSIIDIPLDTELTVMLLAPNGSTMVELVIEYVSRPSTLLIVSFAVAHERIPGYSP